MKSKYRWTRKTLTAIMVGLSLAGLLRLVLAIVRGNDLSEPLGVMLLSFALATLVYFAFLRSRS